IFKIKQSKIRFSLHHPFFTTKPKRGRPKKHKSIFPNYSPWLLLKNRLKKRQLATLKKTNLYIPFTPTVDTISQFLSNIFNPSSSPKKQFKRLNSLPRSIKLWFIALITLPHYWSKIIVKIVSYSFTSLKSAFTLPRIP